MRHFSLSIFAVALACAAVAIDAAPAPPRSGGAPAEEIRFDRTGNMRWRDEALAAANIANLDRLTKSAGAWEDFAQQQRRVDEAYDLFRHVVHSGRQAWNDRKPKGAKGSGATQHAHDDDEDDVALLGQPDGSAASNSAPLPGKLGRLAAGASSSAFSAKATAKEPLPELSRPDFTNLDVKALAEDAQPLEASISHALGREGRHLASEAQEATRHVLFEQGKKHFDGVRDRINREIHGAEERSEALGDEFERRVSEDVQPGITDAVEAVEDWVDEAHAAVEERATDASDEFQQVLQEGRDAWVQGHRMVKQLFDQLEDAIESDE